MQATVGEQRVRGRGAVLAGLGGQLVPWLLSMRQDSLKSGALNGSQSCCLKNRESSRGTEPFCATDSWQRSLGTCVHAGEDKGTHSSHLQSWKQQALGICNKQKLVNQLSEGFPEDLGSMESAVQLRRG